MLSLKSVLFIPKEKLSFHLLRSGVSRVSDMTGITHIANVEGLKRGGGQWGCRGAERVMTDMRMSCALSKSLLLAELMKMPSSSVAELLDERRLCRPTRPFQPRPGEALHTEPSSRLRTFTFYFTSAAAFISHVDSICCCICE